MKPAEDFAHYELVASFDQKHELGGCSTTPMDGRALCRRLDLTRNLRSLDLPRHCIDRCGMPERSQADENFTRNGLGKNGFAQRISFYRRRGEYRRRLHGRPLLADAPIMVHDGSLSRHLVLIESESSKKPKIQILARLALGYASFVSIRICIDIIR